MYSLPGKHSVPRRNGSGPCALSFAQQRLWFLDQLAPGGSAYNAPIAFRLEGPLDVAALEQSLNEIARRHETLRTTFTLSEEQPVQVIAPETIVALPVADLQNYPESEREARAARLVGEEARRPFDLARGPLLRCLLWRLATEDHILLLTMHHIVSDGWSMGVLYRELSALYETFRQGKAPSLPELPIQYADFAVWQREWLRGEVLERQLSYWKRQLGGVQLLELPTDRPRSAVQSLRGTTQSFMLPKDLSEALNALSRKEGVTLFMTLLAAFQILLHRYTGQEDIAVGSPIANRTRSEIEGLIGFFVNTLVLRTDLSGSPSFRELLSRVRRAALDAYSHQDLPFEKLVEELNPERDPSRSPLFQVMFALQNAPMNLPILAGLNVSPVELGAETAKFDLTLSLKEAAGSLTATLEYNTDLFEHATISRMLGHFQTLLEGLVTNPDQRLSELPILTETERHQLLIEWNDTKRDYPKDKCIHELFEEQAERTPDAVAVIVPSAASGHGEDEQLTYRELNRRANQLAHYLQRLGVGPEILVGLCVERSPEMVVGMLGILKAGGAYVPFDATYPKERLAFMLEDAQVSVLLTQQRARDRLPESQRRIVCLDTSWGKIAQENGSNPKTEVRERNLAYVIYTSGTTGIPNGVMVEHRSLVNYLRWFNEAPLSEKLGILPVTARPTFDASLKQLFAPLLKGGPVWLLPEEVVNQPAALLKTLTARLMAGLNCVPSLWKAMLDAIDSDQEFAPPESPSFLFLGGESFDKPLIDRTLATFRGMEIWNLYGPTEATANATAGRIFPDGAITLGRPIANMQVYILDAYLQPVPTGVAGELHIGGAGLARGYLNSPELTAEKFIPHPFSTEPDARLYKTGDLARYLPDGNIEFLGRMDNQIKIRGFRVEPGEIEAALVKHPSVREAAVVARAEIENPKSDIQNPKRLVAYVVFRESQVPAAELRDFLKSRLPDYMVPSAFVALAALPLTPNGKIDRRALPAPDPSRPELKNTFVAPRNALETTLAAIWTQVLGLERVGVHDNFFDLGGHSLLATQVISRVREARRVEVNLRTFFEKPTVAGIAEVIERAKDSDAESATPKIPRVSRRSQP
jgi:surfactin family lipopeptide synthetase A